MPWGDSFSAAPTGGGAAQAQPAAGAAAAPDAKLGSFLEELDATAKADSVWTSATQIDRLTKPGSKYLNLNPYEVVQLEPDTDPKVMQKQIKKLRFLVHPDRNRDNQELATKAFEAVGEAKRMLEDEDKMSFVHKVLDEAKEKTKFQIAEQRGKSRKTGGNQPPAVDPKVEFDELYKKNSKLLFAEYAKRKERLENEQAEAKKKNEQAKAEAFAKRKREKEEEDAWNAGRNNRIDSWRDFEKKKKKKKKTGGLGFMKIPKLKTETRPDKPK
eukprot:m.38581 g.38581  ORF g.38581 m.38581 type:complete len:271 (+) comp5676_c0_seq2:223-1035(+)